MKPRSTRIWPSLRRPPSLLASFLAGAGFLVGVMPLLAGAFSGGVFSGVLGGTLLVILLGAGLAPCGGVAPGLFGGTAGFFCGSGSFGVAMLHPSLCRLRLSRWFLATYR